MGRVELIYYRRFRKIKLLPGFIGAILEYGGAWRDFDDASSDNSIFSGSVFLGVDSPLGPVQLGVGISSEGYKNIYYRIGRMF